MTLTLDQLLNGASEASIDERERYVVMFTTGMNGYVCRNEGIIEESRSLYRGTYRSCQIWIERRGVFAAMQYLQEHISQVSELSAQKLSVPSLSEIFSRLHPLS
jgi:hypothetical protein